MVIFFFFLIFFAGGIEAGLVLSAVISRFMLLHLLHAPLQRTQIWVISSCCSADLRKEIYKYFLPTCTAVVLLIKRFVSCRSRRRRRRCRGFLKLPIQKCALCFLLPVVSRTIGTQSVELFLKVCFPC